MQVTQWKSPYAAPPNAASVNGQETVAGGAFWGTEGKWGYGHLFISLLNLQMGFDFFFLKGHLKSPTVAKNLEATKGDYFFKNRNKDSTAITKDKSTK